MPTDTKDVSSKDVKEAVDELGRVWKQFREENDKLLAEGKQTQKEWSEKLQKLNDRMKGPKKDDDDTDEAEPAG